MIKYAAFFGCSELTTRDSWCRAGGDWGAVIQRMRICTHRYTPLRQGNQERGIQRLLVINYCDSQRSAGGDWEVGIQKMRVHTHRDTPRHQGD